MQKYFRAVLTSWPLPLPCHSRWSHFCLSGASPSLKATDADPVCPVTPEPAATDIPLVAQGNHNQLYLLT